MDFKTKLELNTNYYIVVNFAIIIITVNDIHINVVANEILYDVTIYNGYTTEDSEITEDECEIYHTSAKGASKELLAKLHKPIREN